jgi:hypothetical protein
MSECSESYHLRSERADASRYSREALVQLVPNAESSLLDELERRLHPRGFDELMEVKASRLLADALGPKHYDWLSYDYITSDAPSNHLGVTKVR